ncbi:MAG TPA: hypothetical protein VGM06_07515 [Polyangiaceae bacterium]|jgi:hypothetical protein
MSPRLFGWAPVAVLGLLASSCGGRSPFWDAPASNATSYGMSGGVALVDDADHRVVILTAMGTEGQLQRTNFTIGHNVASVTTSAAGDRLFILTSGDPPGTPNGDPPALTTITLAADLTPSPTSYPMTVALPNLALDPLGDWAVAYAGSTPTEGFVQNPNELVFFDLTSKAAPVARNFQSFGGSPVRLTFTPKLALPGGAKRLLIIETGIDITMADLDDAITTMPPEITLRLSGANATQVSPAAVTVDSFDPTSPADARVALRANGDRDVFTFTFAASPAGSLNPFVPVPNLTDVGGVPSDIAFVHTDAGLRLAALVPQTSSAVLVDPDSNATTQVALPAGYSNLSLVTNVVSEMTTTAGTDVAMLWNANGSSSGVALWALGSTVGQPYFSVEVLGVSQAIQTVEDVPSQSTTAPSLKVLEATSSNRFFVLDLSQRTVAPLNTNGPATIVIASDGGRLWAFAQGGTDLAEVTIPSLNPILLKTSLPIANLYDVQAVQPLPSGTAPPPRALIAIHNTGAMAATVFNATNPAAAPPTLIPALLLEGR